MKSLVRLSGVWVGGLLLCAFGATSALGQGTPQFNHIIWVMEENLNYSDITSSTWPNLFSLGHTWGYSSNFFSDTHPSIGNYEEDISGVILTNDDACNPNGSGGSDCPFPSTVDNIVRELLAKGLTWKSYAECIPNAGYLGGDYVAPSCPTDLSGDNTYYVRHNPFPYYSDVFNNQTQAKNIVPFSQFATDVAAKNLPTLAYVAPDGCDDAHDCPSYPGNINLTADTWLQTNVIGPLTDPSGYGPIFENGDVLIVTFDESRNDNTNGGGKIFIAIASPKYSKVGYDSSISYGEGALACTLLQGLGLTAVYGDACTKAPPNQYATTSMSDFFVGTPSFTMAANPNALTIEQGSSGTSTITVIDYDGFNGEVTLSASGLPSGVTAGFVPNPTTTTSTLTLTVGGGAPLGTNNITISGVSGSLTSDTTIALTVTASATLSFSPTSLGFGNQAENTTSASKTVTVTNNGPGSVSFTSIATDNSDYSVAGNTCTGTLNSGQKCMVGVTFTPTKMGADNGNLVFSDNASGSPQKVPLTGTGIAPVTLSPTSANFGNVGENTPSTVHNFTLTNNQSGALTITSITTGNPDYTETDTCDGSVAAHGHCTISVTLTPSKLGTDTGTLTVNDSASNSPQTASLTGTGVVPAALSPSSANFGNVAQGTPSSVHNFTLTSNNQTGALAITSITTGNPDYTETDTCDGSVAAKGHCTISVTLTPSKLGTDTGTLTVSDSASNSPQTASLTGNGIAQVTLTPSSMTFAPQTVGTSSGAKIATLTNNLGTGLAVTISIGGANPGDYSQTNTCNGSVGAHSHCSISVTFKPTATGTRTATLSVSDSANNSPQTVSLTGTGK